MPNKAMAESQLATGNSLNKIFVKNRRKIGDLIYDYGLTN